LFIAVPRVTEMQRCSTSDTRRQGARAEMRESVCERARTWAMQFNFNSLGPLAESECKRII